MASPERRTNRWLLCSQGVNGFVQMTDVAEQIGDAHPTAAITGWTLSSDRRAAAVHSLARGSGARDGRMLTLKDDKIVYEVNAVEHFLATAPGNYDSVVYRWAGLAPRRPGSPEEP